MKRFVILTLCVILLATSMFGQVSARSLADREKDLYLKPGPSPMDKKPDIVTLKEGDLVSRVQAKSILLDGEWLLTDKGMDKWDNAYKVNVPGSILHGLHQAGVIKDPYMGKNDFAAKAQTEKTWYLKKTFSYSGSKKNVELYFHGVADRCDVYLNGKRISSHQGMFGGPKVDVTDSIKIGQNELAVVLKPVLPWQQTVVFNCSYGWHYSIIPPMGIWNSVEISDLPDVEFDSPFIATYSYKKGTMDLSIDLRAVDKDASMKGVLTGTIKPKNFQGKTFSFTYNINGEKGKDANVRLRFDMPEFKLWWPNGYGEQNLYTLELSFKSDSGEVTYSKTSFGIRELVLDPFPTGETESMYNRTVVINGRKLFMKGAGWCTIDALMRFTREDYDRILRRAKEQGLNFLRAWGGGMPETDDFYDLCDEYGITVYQEWPSCWDSHDSQPANVFYETVILNTKRIRNRPSLIIYGGGNEGAGAFESVTLNNIGKLTYEYDGTRTFYRQDGGPGGAGMGHDHIHWGGQSPEHYITAYANRLYLNLHEYGLDSMMNLESIARYATKEEMEKWPIDPEGTIAHHTATFNGNLGWNESPHGHDVDTLMHYASYFLNVKSLKDLVIGTQLAQTMATYLPIQNARINFPNVTKIAYYKLNDVFPGASWSTVDWYGVPKIAHYFVQDANRTLMATGHFDRYNTYDKQQKDFNLPIYILDDNGDLKNSSWKVIVKAYDKFLNVVKSEEFSGSGGVGTNKHIGDFYLTEKEADSSPLFIVIDLVKDGDEPIRSYTFMNFDRIKGSLFTLPRTTLEYSVSGNRFTVKNTGNVPAVSVNFKNSKVSDVFWCEDNYFWLEPGESKTIEVNMTDGVDGFDAFNLSDADDKKAPGQVPKLEAKSTSSSVTLSWRSAKDDKKVMGYYIYMNDVLMDFVGSDYLTYTVTGLDENTEYTFYVVAVDYNMNESKASKKITVTTKPDTERPYAVSVKVVDRNTVVVRYNKDMNKESAEDKINYAFNFDVQINSISLAEDLRTVTIKTSDMDFESNKRYSLLVLGARDSTYTGNQAARRKFYLHESLAGYWSFDEGKGDYVHDLSGKYEEPGVIAKAEWTEGVSGSALDFDKLGNVYVGMSDFYVSDGATISMWLKPSDLSGFGVIIAKGPKEAGHFEIYSKDGNLLVFSPDVGDLALKVNMSSMVDTWNHFAFIINQSRIMTYVNGELASTTAVGRFKDVDGDLAIGALADASLPFGGAIDEVYLFERELDVDEISYLAMKSGDIRDMVLNENFRKMNIGEVFKLNAVFHPEGVEGRNIVWSVDNAEVASIDNGVVTALDYGFAVVTVMTEDGEFIDRCFVEVGDFKKKVDPVLITAICCGVFLILIILFSISYKFYMKRKKNMV